MEHLYDGIFIPDHQIIDASTKEEADSKLYNWEASSLPADQWIEKLNAGHIIQPSKFKPKENGKITHSRENWDNTHFICADGDHIRNVEFYEKDVLDAQGSIIHKTGDDKNPNGIENWTEAGQLSNKYPDLLIDAYAVGESISSMLKEPLHRRYRIIFLFDKPIESESHFRNILAILAEKYHIIDRSSRAPSQPVYGNGRKGFDFHICGNILNLDDYPEPVQEEQAHHNSFTKQQTLPNETLEEYLNRHNISYEPSKDNNKYYVECPFKTGHTGGKQSRTDSYVWDDGKWSYYCSHAHCVHKRTWESFKEGHGINSKFNNKNGKKGKENGGKQEENTKKTDNFNPILLAEDLMKRRRYFFTQENIHRYNDDTGIYEECALELKHDIRSILENDSRINRLNEITAHIRDMSNEGEKANGVCMQNGVLDLNTLKLKEHSPDNFFLQGFPVDFNIEAKSNRFDEWLQEVIPDIDCQKTIFEMIGSCFDPNSNFLQTGFLLTGSGSNGKSLLLEILSILIGEENICRTPFPNFGKDRFSVSTLVNKSVSIDDDIQTDQPLTSTIKPLITARNLQCERKYENAFNFQLQATFIGAINGSPSATDTSSAFWRRWCVIPFEKKFKKDATLARKIIEECSEPEILSGILNTALLCYKEVLEKGEFTTPEASKTTIDAMQADSNHVIEFIEETLEFDTNKKVARKNLRAAYLSWCITNDFKKYSDRRFYSAIREYPGITETKYQGQRMFKGIFLAEGFSL